MSTEEFSNEFDTILLSYNIRDLFGLTNPIAFDEYEKSIFLTKALLLLIITLYNGNNSSGDSFEKTEELRRYLSDLVKTKVISKDTNNHLGISTSSLFFILPDDLWFITYESVYLSSEDKCLNNKNIIVQPVRLDDYYKVSKNPFRLSNTNRALRLDIKDNIVEIVSLYNISKYLVRYLSKPEPIVLIDLEGLTIDNVSTLNECKLNPALHRLILEEAVRLAIASKGIKANNNTN